MKKCTKCGGYLSYEAEKGYCFDCVIPVEKVERLIELNNNRIKLLECTEPCDIQPSLEVRDRKISCIKMANNDLKNLLKVDK